MIRISRSACVLIAIVTLVVVVPATKAGPAFAAAGAGPAPSPATPGLTPRRSEKATGAVPSCTPDFTAAPSSPEPAGTSPRSVAFGDFNGDGRQDLATANQNSANVTILLGDGTGDFTAPATSPEPVGSVPGSVAVGDFNGDGRQDLATANFGSDNVTILLGDGMGDFTAPATSPEPAGTGPVSVAVGDFNGDGRQDLATANQSSNNVTILLGDGMGDFTAAASSPEPVGTLPISVAVGDFNGDGRQDLATANFLSNNVTILLGDGMGDFTAPATSPEPVGVNPLPIAVGDFNGDGRQDLATANAGSNNVTILLGDGTGDFTAAATSPEPAGTSPRSVAVGDFNGDGRQDVATANVGSNNVTILLGDGMGDFTAAASSPEPVGSVPDSVAVGDFNGDGRQDLATANFSSNNVTILLGSCPAACDPDFTAAPSSPEPVGSFPFSVAVGDFNGDGRQDLATANSGSNNVTIVLGDGTGDFTAAASSPEPVGTGPVSAAVGDFNGDGRQDLATANFSSANVTILLGDGMGDFTAAASSPEPVGTATRSVAVGDFNGDGRQDLATANQGSNNVTILLGDGMGDFTAAASSPEPVGTLPVAVAVGDFNGDGRQDLAIANSSNVTILLGDGMGDFTAAASSPEPVGSVPGSVAVGDFNGDGRQDLATANFASANVTILLGDGTGDFTAPATSPEPVGTLPVAVAVGDFNGDGRQDLATANLSSNNVTILLGDGTGDFTAAASSPEPVGTGPRSVAVGDFNGDGRQDLATANSNSNNVTILLGGCTTCVLTLTCPSDVTVANTPGQCNATVMYSDPTVPPDCTGATVTCSPASGSTFVVGTTTVTCSATEPGGQMAACSFTVTVQDTQAPVITCPANVTVPNDANVCGATVKFADPTTSDNCPGTTVVCSPVTGSLFPIGDTTVTCTATDASNNTSSCSFTVTVQDTQAPVASCPAPVTVPAAAGTCAAVVNYTATASDNCPGVGIVCVPASGSTFPVGVTTVNCTATDASGNTGACAFTVTVQDTQLPAVTCPANITVTTDTSNGCTFTAVVNYPAPTATDNCAIASVVCVPPSGSTFNEGTTTVTCTATDTSGNTAACTFTVTVGAAFGFCSMDDATGNTFQMVVNPASPSYGVWRFTVVATNTIYCGRANYVNYFPGVRLRAYDNDYSAENPTFFMDANFKGTAGTVTVRNVSGTVRLTLRDRNLLDSVCP